MNRRDGTPQRFNQVGLRKRVVCHCGATMRACNLARHQLAAHDPNYVPPSRTKSYRRLHRTHVFAMTQDRRAYYDNEPGTLYVIHFARPIGGHAAHYMGWTANLMGRLVAHQRGMGSKLTREAWRLRITFALTWTESGTRDEEARIKKNRRLSELCSVCRHDALEKRATRMRAWRARRAS